MNDKEFVDNITEEDVLIQETNRIGRKYLVCYNYQFDESLPKLLKEGNQRILHHTIVYYELLRDRAIKLNIDISKYPERLEELTN